MWKQTSASSKWISRSLRTTASTFSVLALFAACGADSSSTPDPVEAAVGAIGVTSESGGGRSCLGDYSDDLCKLLGEEMVRSHFPEMPEDAEQESRNKGFNMCMYSWPGPRMGSQEVAGRVIEYGLDDRVAMQWLRVLDVDDPLARFRNSYRAMTPEEKAEMAGRFRQGMAEKVEKGEITEQGAEIGEGLGAGLIDGLTFEAVAGVGTAAAWGGTGDQPSLKVLDGDTEFEIVVDVYEEEDRNRQAAIEIAAQVLETCD